MPQSLRRRILSTVMRDTSKLQFLMKPKNSLKLSTNFVNFGHQNPDSLEDNLNQVLTVETDLSMLGIKERIPSTACQCYLTGITNSNDKNKRKNMFRHSISSDTQLPLLIDGKSESGKGKSELNSAKAALEMV